MKRTVQAWRTPLIACLLCLLVSACGSNAKRDEFPVGVFSLKTEWHGEERMLALRALGNAQPAVRMLDVSDDLVASGASRWRFYRFGQGVYRIVNDDLGETLSLAVTYREQPGQIELTNTARVSSQLWYVVPLDNGYCRLTSVFFGESQALDIINDGENRTPKLASSGNYSGQHWRLKLSGPAPTDERLGQCSGAVG